MSNAFIAFMFAAGVTTWVYTKFQKRTGNYTQRSVTGALVAGVISFLFFLTVLWTVN